jgi:hypothetical protein
MSKALVLGAAALACSAAGASAQGYPTPDYGYVTPIADLAAPAYGYAAQTYAAPAPIYAAPPVYAAPVYAAPVYPAPVYPAPPVYAQCPRRPVTTLRLLLQGRYITTRQGILVVTAIGSVRAPSTCQTNSCGPVEGLNLRPKCF